MQQKITSSVIGNLTQDEAIPDWWNAENIPIPFFDNQKLTVTFQDYTPGTDDKFLTEADAALTNFFQKTSKDKLDISHLVFKKFEQIKAEVAEDQDEIYWSEGLQNIKDVHEIWKFVQPTGLSLERRKHEEHDMYLVIYCECEWEEEHGLQLVFRQGRKITRVSEIDGHVTHADAYDIPDEEDELLSRFGTS